MRKRTAGRKSIPLAVIILAFFHWFSYHYGALSQTITAHPFGWAVIVLFPENGSAQDLPCSYFGIDDRFVPCETGRENYDLYIIKAAVVSHGGLNI